MKTRFTCTLLRIGLLSTGLCFTGLSVNAQEQEAPERIDPSKGCLLYTSDAADE